MNSIISVTIFMQQSLTLRESADVDGLSSIIFKIRKHTNQNIALIFVIFVTLILRILVGYGSYSGYDDPPHYGDFEA